MKSVKQIAQETGLEIDVVRVFIKGNNIQNALHKRKMYLDTENEVKLHQVLFFAGKLKYLILESKINKK